MAINKRWCSGALAVLVAAGLLSVPATSAGATPALSPDGTRPVAAGPDATAVQGTVTLLTGDRVTLHGNGQVSVTPGAGRESREDIAFTTYQLRGEVYALPTDASALVADGRLDPALFNVTALIEAGYDDASRDDLPLLVTRTARLRTDARDRLTDAGVRVTGELRSAEAFAVRADHADLPGFWQAIVDGDLARGSTVWLDQKVQPALADSVPQVGAPAAWAAGFDGTGTTVAVLDTGVDAAHPDLAGKVVGTANFTPETGLDLIGHGTHVASTIAGTGAASGGANRGVAPGASLLSGKVCDGDGCQFSAIIAGMEWAAGQGADVVNMSLSGGNSFGVDPLEEAVNNLTASTGTLFVAAAGNAGRARTVGSPGTAEAALSVGAVDGADQLATFSSQGPTAGESAIKPDITAPGVAVTAARSQHSPLPGTAYTTLQGTSMATPHVAGAAAILAQRNPSWTAELLKSALMGSADPNPALGSFAQGAGRLAVDEVINQRVTASPASVSLGALQQDTTPGQTVARTVTYRNHGTAGVTLNLGLTTTAPAGMFSLSASSVTVPAGGQASVTLTTNIGLSVPAGIYGGRITATGGGMEVHTPFGIDRQAKLTINHTGRFGGEPFRHADVFLPVDGHSAYTLENHSGTFVGWVPAGPYLAHSWLFDLAPSGPPETTVLTIPRLDATGSHPVHFDARLGQPVSITVPDPAAQLSMMEIGSSLTVPDVGFVSVTSTATSLPAFSARLGTNPHVVGYLAKVTTVHYVPGPTGERDAPKVYRTAWFFPNQPPTGLVRNVPASSYATVEGRHAAQTGNSVGYTYAFADPVGSFFGSGGARGLPMGLPFNRTEYYHAEGNIRFQTFFQEFEADTLRVQELQTHSIAYTAGSTQVRSWNAPVYGPALANPHDPISWAARIGNEIGMRLPLFGDGAGHAGYSNGDLTPGQLTLSRGGQILYQVPYFGGPEVFVVPPEFGSYQLTATAEREAPMELSTRLSAKWTFSSQEVNGGFPLRLPLWSVQAAPALDATGTAPAGQPFTIPLRAAPQPGSAAAGLRALTVQYSVNDGATWQPATVSPAAGGGHLAQLTHPGQAGFVSLRITVTDWSGNALEQEVIRAYRIG